MKKLSLRGKILASCLVWMTLMLVIGSLIYFNQIKQDKILTNLKQSRILTEGYTELLNIMINMETGIRGYLLAGTEDYLEPFNKTEALFDQQIKGLIESDIEAVQKSRLNSVWADKQKWMDTVSTELISKKKADRNLITYKEFIDQFKLGRGKIFSEKVQTAINFALLAEKEKVNLLSTDYNKSSLTIQRLIVWFLPLAILIGAFILMTIIFRVTQHLCDVAKDLEVLSQNLFSSAQQVSDITTMSSNSAAQQASSLDKATSTMLEVTKIVKINAEKATVADKASQDSTTLGRNAEKNTAELVLSTKEASLSSQRIGDIVDHVDQISFQTKLLALNASVEAARAGESGKGFAVVADSIGTLAQNTEKATKEISVLINNNNDVTAVGLGKLEKTQENIQNLISSLNKIAILTNEVALGSNAQSKSVQQLSNTLSAIDETVQKNTAINKESKEIVKSLFDQSQDLIGAIKKMNFIIRGKDENI